MEIERTAKQEAEHQVWKRKMENRRQIEALQEKTDLEKYIESLMQTTGEFK